MPFKKIRIKTRIIPFTLTLMTLLATSQSYAIESDDSWKFEVAPYIWAMNMNGRVQTGNKTAHIAQTFSDILSQLNWAGMVYLDAHKDKLGLYFNAMYAVLSQTDKTGPINVNLTTKYGVFGAGVSYQVYKKILANQVSQVNVEPYVGLRYTIDNTTLKIARFSFTNNQNWTDPVIGAKVNYIINKQWLAFVAGDVGGTNFNNHNSYSANAFIGYKPQSFLTNTTVYAGYRLLYQYYITGSGTSRFGWDMKLFGPVVGLGINF